MAHSADRMRSPAAPNGQEPADVCPRCSQLEEALETRTIIAEALGILMERYSLTNDDSFAVLRKASQNSNTRLREIADKIVGDHNRSVRAQ